MGVPPSAIGHVCNRMLLLNNILSSVTVGGRQQAYGGEIALGVALPDIHRQIGHRAGVPFVEAERAWPEGPIRSRERLVDCRFYDRTGAPGDQFRQAGPVGRVVWIWPAAAARVASAAVNATSTAPRWASMWSPAPPLATRS